MGAPQSWGHRTGMRTLIVPDTKIGSHTPARPRPRCAGWTARRRSVALRGRNRLALTTQRVQTGDMQGGARASGATADTLTDRLTAGRRCRSACATWKGPRAPCRSPWATS
eukprot:5149347-Prymnesium_polylepis.1